MGLIDSVLGKSVHETPKDAVEVALDEKSEHNCASLTFEAIGGTFTVQFVNSEERVHNLAGGIGSTELAEAVQEIGLPVNEAGDGYVLFESDATTADEAIEEIDEIASACGADSVDVETAKSFETAVPTPFENLKSALGVDT